ncbi:MAG: (2Fe-2S) ferredoxin domain-containing protein [Candidatus Omnitrophota bacterium]
MGITQQDLLQLKEKSLKDAPKNWIRVGYSTCGVAAGADVVYKVLAEEVAARGLSVEVKKCGCVGLCSAEPLVEVNVEGAPHVFYGKVNKEVAHKIMEEHVCQKKLVENHIFEM